MTLRGIVIIQDAGKNKRPHCPRRVNHFLGMSPGHENPEVTGGSDRLSAGVAADHTVDGGSRETPQLDRRD